MGMRVVLLLLLLVDMMEIHIPYVSYYDISILFTDCLRFECGRSLAARSLAVPREVCTTPMTPNNVETRNERKQ